MHSVPRSSSSPLVVPYLSMHSAPAATSAATVAASSSSSSRWANIGRAGRGICHGDASGVATPPRCVAIVDCSCSLRARECVGAPLVDVPALATQHGTFERCLHQPVPVPAGVRQNITVQLNTRTRLLQFLCISLHITGVPVGALPRQASSAVRG